MASVVRSPESKWLNCVFNNTASENLVVSELLRGIKECENEQKMKEPNGGSLNNFNRKTVYQFKLLRCHPITPPKPACMPPNQSERSANSFK